MLADRPGTLRSRRFAVGLARQQGFDHDHRLVVNYIQNIFIDSAAPKDLHDVGKIKICDVGLP